MQAGKLASQAGHAYLGAFISAQARPEGVAYSTLSPGTKVCLQGTLAQLGRAVDQLERAGIPHYVVVDSGCPDFFSGNPVLTAIGFGPCTKAVARKITKGLKLL